MGITTALNTTVGSNPSRELKMMSKLLVVACAAVAVSAEADAGVYGYAPALLNAYPNWPGVSTPYSQSTSFVARSPQGLGKRSADADPALLYGAYGVAPYVTGNTYGYGPSGYGISQGHPGAAVSHQFVSRL